MIVNAKAGSVGLTRLCGEDYRGETANAVEQRNQRRQNGDIFEPLPADSPQEASLGTFRSIKRFFHIQSASTLSLVETSKHRNARLNLVAFFYDYFGRAFGRQIKLGP